MAVLSLPAAATLTACSNVHFVGPLDTSTADRPSAYSPATKGPDGYYYGTHFRYALPSGWAVATGPSRNIEVWIKRAPLSRPGPIIAVTALDTPPDLPLAAYADIMLHKDLQTHGEKAIGGITSASLDGRPAQEYEYRSKVNIYRTMISFRGGVVYFIQMAAPSDQFAAAASGPFRAFVSSWRWE